ncbi:CoA-transferase, partial [Acinetobacter baumannii]|uniref:CoA-transferase n=2 Tax=Acinetobacter TaxID=469 RepID=UPI001D17AF40
KKTTILTKGVNFQMLLGGHFYIAANNVTIAQVSEVVELGGLDPEHIITPGIFVQHVVQVQPAQ